MEPTERIRELHKPDWMPVLLGVVCTMAASGVLTRIGMFMSMFELKPDDSIPLLVVKILWILGTVAVSMFLGSFIAGMSLGYRSRIAAALNGLLIWVVTVVLFNAAGWFGFAIIPGVYFAGQTGEQASAGILWIAMGFGLPLAFAAVFGAMAGNDHSRGPVLPEEREAKHPINEERAVYLTEDDALRRPKDARTRTRKHVA